MKIKDLIEALKQFDEDKDVSILIATGEVLKSIEVRESIFDVNTIYIYSRSLVTIKRKYENGTSTNRKRYS